MHVKEVVLVHINFMYHILSTNTFRRYNKELMILEQYSYLVTVPSQIKPIVNYSNRTYIWIQNTLIEQSDLMFIYSNHS